MYIVCIFVIAVGLVYRRCFIYIIPIYQQNVPGAIMTTSAQITHDLYKYLVQYQVLPNTLKYKPSGNYQLDGRSQQQLQCGYLVAKLLTVLAAEKGVKLNAPLITSIKNSNTPASRVYNWNILTQGFTKIGIILPKERQKEITSGNFNTLVLFLLDVQNKGNQKKIQKTVSTPSVDQGLDIKKIHKYEQITQSQTVLQFMIVLIMKTMGLNGKQAVATLAQSAKYLAHMIVKGVKNSFQQIVSFIEETRSFMDKIMYLAEKDAEKNLQFLLQIFKPTLISRDPDVAKAGSLLLKALAYETLKYNSKNILYQILSKQDEGFDFLYMGLKRHPYLNFQIFDFLNILLQGALQDFLDVQLKRTINNQQEYIKALILILQPLLLNKQAKAQLFKTRLIAQWQKNLDSTSTSKLKGKDPILLNQQTKYQYIQLMYTLWMGYYKDFQPQYAEQLLIKITEQLKKNTRSDVYAIRIPSLLKLFNLLEYLAANRNKLAALLYKKIIFLFVQNHNEQQMRQIVLQNLTIIIQKFPTIPLQFLLQPMLKQLTNKQGTTYILNMYDFEFIIELCKHPKMEEYYAITFLDYFIKLYTKSVIYSSLIFRVIQAITARFCQSEQIREYCLRSTDLCLNNYGMLVMGKTKGNKAQYNVSKGQQKQQQILNNQKKSLTIELIKHFITLEHRELTEQIKQKVATLFIDWYENRSHYDKGLAAILMQIGDIQDILIQFKQKTQQSEKSQEVESNEFYSKATDSGRDKKSDRRVDSNLAKYMNQDGDRSTPQLQDIGLGYKKKKIDLTNKYQYLANRSKNIKPDPKVLEDIQKIKQKWRLDQSRAKLEQQQAKKDKIGKINQVQLLQRNLSLGYAKLPQLNSDQILFELDSVKKKYLKDTLDIIVIQNEEDRQLKSFLNIIQRYQKYIKSLFINYASKSGPMSDNKQMNILSFTEIMRMLKDKGLLTKIPKIAINQIITTINQKRKKQRNVLGGVYEQDFPTFILYFTDLILQQDTQNKKDEPYGLKVEKVILKMLEGQKNVKQLFDPKIQKLKEELEYNENIQIPHDLKKVKESQIELDYIMREDFKIQNSFLDCYEIVDGLVYEAVGVHIISPVTELKQKYTLMRVFKNPQVKLATSQSVDKKLQRTGTEEVDNTNGMLKKDILADSQNSFTKPLKKLSKNLIKKKSQSQRHVGPEQLAEKQAKQAQKAERDKKREIHAQKLKQQILKMKEQKQKVEAEKKEKDKLEEQKKKKKQELRQQYLEQNKRKLKQKKEDDDKKAQEQKRIEQENKQKRKAQVKAKQVQMLQKERKLIEAKRQKLAQKAKEAEFKQKEKQKLAKNKSTDKLLGQMKVSAADQRMKDLLIKNSMENGQIKELLDKNKKNFEDLFELYWNWQKQKIQLKNLAQMFKDLDSSKYIYPKQIADVYKRVAKGQLLNLQNFIECIVKLSYQSEQIESQIKKSNPKKEQDPNSPQKNGNNKVDVGQFEFMLKLLKMNEHNYKQTITRIKQQKQAK